MTRLILVFFAALTLSPALAQQDRMPSFAEMQRRMMEMQQRMMQQLQDGGSWGNGSFRQDTSFFFQFDTTFSSDGGGGRMHFFRSSPFGNDSTRVNPGGLGDFWGFDRIFEDFFDFGTPGSDLDIGGQQMPKDDGNLNRTEDDLLPEERLRQQEKAKQQPQKAQPAAPKEKDKKPKIKTIQI